MQDEAAEEADKVGELLKGVSMELAGLTQALQGTPAVSDPVASRATGRLVVNVAVPVKTDGRVTGVLFGSLGKSSASEAQGVSAAAEEQLASMEEIASSSQELARLAQDLQGAVTQFRL